MARSKFTFKIHQANYPAGSVGACHLSTDGISLHRLEEMGRCCIVNNGNNLLGKAPNEVQKKNLIYTWRELQIIGVPAQRRALTSQNATPPSGHPDVIALAHITHVPKTEISERVLEHEKG
eukprot:scaffold1462_cov64-Cyclotella_meneghiniana.AAC.4